MINWAIYSLHVRSGNDENSEGDLIELCELLIPMGLSLLLCFTHSHIVATSVFPLHTSNKSRREKINCSKNRDKSRRKKKFSRQRPNSSNNGNNKDDDNLKGYDSDDEQSVVMQNNSTSNAETSHDNATPMLRRRNVNWNLNANDINGNNGIINSSVRSTEDDGFESFKEELSGKSSSGEDLRVNRREEDSNSDTETLKNSERSTPVKMNRQNLQYKHSSDSEGDVDSPTASN